MPRFVVLRHEPPDSGGKPLHWDFMLEWGELLRTWSLNSEPQPNREIDAERLSDHRLAYLDYEGQVSGNRGTVRQWDVGSYEPRHDEENVVIVHLHGKRLVGEATLRQSPNQTQRWMFALVPSSSTNVR